VWEWLSLFAERVLAKPYHFEVNETKMRHISLPSNLNVIIGITRYYCVILKMVILHGAIETIQSGVFVFLKKGTKTCFFSKKQKMRIKKQVGCFFKKTYFSQS